MKKININLVHSNYSNRILQRFYSTIKDNNSTTTTTTKDIPSSEQTTNSNSSTTTTQNQPRKSLFDSQPSIASNDLRNSPFNLSLEPKKRLEDIKNLKKFIPGDIFKPEKLVKENLLDRINKTDSTIERGRLTRKILTPYYQDLHDIRNTDGKLFEANEDLLDSKEALYMPNLSIERLLPKQEKDQMNKKAELLEVLENKISLVAFYLSQYGENQCQSFVQPFIKLLEQKPEKIPVQLVEINVAEQWPKALISKLFRKRIQVSLSPLRQSNYFFKYGSMEELRERCAMVNGMMGYVFLVDKHVKIRWYANGEATDLERNTLLKLTKKLALEN